MTTKNKIILAASAAALLFLTGMISGCLIHRSYVRAHQLPVQRDTVTKWRTATTESPAPTESHKGTDPVSIPVSELTPSQDSSAVLVQQDIRTYDDLTKQTICDAFGRKNVLHPELEQWLRDLFAARNRPMAANNLQQAYLPYHLYQYVKERFCLSTMQGQCKPIATPHSDL